MSKTIKTHAATLIAAALLTLPALAQTTLYTVRGDHDFDHFGFCVSGAGDVDGDGFADFIVGTHDNVFHHNEARVVSGQTGLPIYTLVEGGTLYGFGFAVAGAGDVDHDGFADFIIGAPLYTDAMHTGGAAFVFSGRTGALLYAFYGESAGGEFGGTVNGAGDVNGDGYADVIVGAYYAHFAGQTAGRVRVFSGRDGSVLYTYDGDAPGDLLGASVAGAGDVNGDGFADFVAGAIGSSAGGNGLGLVRVYSGHDGSVLHEFYGEAPGDQFGHAVASAGDVDGDGHPDLIVGAPLNALNGTSSGAAYILSGLDGSLLLALHGHAAQIQFGWSVAGAGDVDGDGHADVIVGANFDDTGSDPNENSGSARVFSGANGAELMAFIGSPKDQLGYSVSGAGDVNRDGHPDVLVGTFMSLAFDGSNAGRAMVYSGATCGPCFPVGTSFCFGHGGGTPCPCNNDSAPGSGQGCLNSSSLGGILGATGVPSVGSDTLVLAAANLPPNVPGVFIQGNAEQAGGFGVMNGDGLLCVGTSLVRMGVSFATSGGASSFPPAGHPSISVSGHVMPGDVRHYQLWYRNAAAFCTSATYNFTNGLTIVWSL
jgi:hypothetical protein